MATQTDGQRTQLVGAPTVVDAIAAAAQVGGLTFQIRDKSRPFSSGKHGFYLGGKLMIGGKMHQLSCSMVELPDA